jgi:ferredoxin-NADP reductase
MPIYQVKLKKRQTLAENTIGFMFEKPAGFAFKAGQFCSIMLPNPENKERKEVIRSLSLASPPYSNELMIVTRMRNSAFKNTLQTLPIGSEIALNASYGTFTLHEDETIPAVFLTGGIGIAPIRSMVLQATQDKTSHHIFLFYSNRRPEDAVFLDELRHVQGENPFYTFIATMTQMQHSKHEWCEATGYIEKNMISQYVSDLLKPIYYIVGPSPMVKALREILTNLGVMETHIRTEEFSGY